MVNVDLVIILMVVVIIGMIQCDIPFIKKMCYSIRKSNLRLPVSDFAAWA